MFKWVSRCAVILVCAAGIVGLASCGGASSPRARGSALGARVTPADHDGFRTASEPDASCTTSEASVRGSAGVQAKVRRDHEARCVGARHLSAEPRNRLEAARPPSRLP